MHVVRSSRWLLDDVILRVADEHDRTIEGMIVPWSRPTYVLTPRRGYEAFKRGALDRSLADVKRRFPLLMDHKEAEVAGVLVDHENCEDGHHAVFRVLRTQAGDDALELVAEGLYLGLSVGGQVVPERTTTRQAASGQMIIERAEIVLDHVALVRFPAYDDAQVRVSGGGRRRARVSGRVPASVGIGRAADPVAVIRARQRLRTLQRAKSDWLIESCRRRAS